MADIYKEIQETQQKGGAGAIASVVARKGSAPMSADAKMLVISGRLDEGDGWRRLS